jgi:hypothetical protein
MKAESQTAVDQQMQQRPPGRPFLPGKSGNPNGRGAPAARARQQAEQDERERQAVAVELEQDIGHAPSASERVIVEQLSMLIMRGRRLRQAGCGADAEMVAGLVLRGMTKLGIKPTPQKAESLEDYLRRTATELATASAACESGPAEQNCPEAEERIGEARSGEASA